MAWPPCPTLPIHPIWPWATFFCFLMKKILTGKHFADMEEVKQRKMAEALKGMKIAMFKTVLHSGKTVSIGVLPQMERTLEVTEV